jgi:hypothetical protein
MNQSLEHNQIIDTVANTTGAPMVRLRQLHHEASKALENVTQIVSGRDISVSLLTPVTIPNAKVAVATDMKTGWFVQLVDQEKKPRLLTIGKKYCMTGYDEVNQTTATQMLP